MPLTDLEGGEAMLADRIKQLLEEINVTISDVARAGYCSPSNLSRLKNGRRIPPPTSPTTISLVNGFIRIADQRGFRGDLCRLCGADLISDDARLADELIEWLYEDEPPYERGYTRHQHLDSPGTSNPCGKLPGFPLRLDRLMKAAGISNGRLGRMTGLDPSYVSRLRRAERFPRYNSPYLEKICRILRDEMLEAGRLSDLADMLARPEDSLAEEEGVEFLRDWLVGYDAVGSHIAAGQLLDAVSSVNRLAVTSLADQRYDIDSILKDCMERSRSFTEDKSMRQYVGIEGLRAAAAGFLADLLAGGEREMLLYSDQSMKWMGGEYFAVLTVLMTECMRRNVHIKAIHNVSRSMTELITAVKWWMPFYLSGNIESYYCKKSAGSRFSHTLFIRPGAACISGTSVCGVEESAVYNYSTSSTAADQAVLSYESMLKDCEPLVRIDRKPCKEEGFMPVNNVLVQAGPDKVVIQRTEKPLLRFTFTHPMICRAFLRLSGHLEAGGWAES